MKTKILLAIGAILLSLGSFVGGFLSGVSKTFDAVMNGRVNTDAECFPVDREAFPILGFRGILIHILLGGKIEIDTDPAHYRTDFQKMNDLICQESGDCDVGDLRKCER